MVAAVMLVVIHSCVVVQCCVVMAVMANGALCGCARRTHGSSKNVRVSVHIHFSSIACSRVSAQWVTALSHRMEEPHLLLFS